MGVSDSAGPGTAQRTGGAPAALVWHELECGGYSADLELWHELAGEARARHPHAAILEVGAGSGRVSLSLARAGHRVTALDNDPLLLRALAQRTQGELEIVCADAREFTLEHRLFALCIVPMQTVQLFGGARSRLAFLHRARAHIAPRGVLAIAIITAFEPFDLRAGDPAPTPERSLRDGRLFVSSATRVRRRVRTTLIERERRILDETGELLSCEHDAIALDNVSAAQLEREGASVGFTPAPRRSVAETAEHVGSDVVVLRA
jgi:SAM-dependent methyltransferase